MRRRSQRMMEKKPEEDAIAESQEKAAAPAVGTRKRKRTTTSAAAAPCPCDAGMCDDVVRNIFARVPARTAVASMALSTHHRRLIRCPEFRSLHCRLGPPLPQPHIAYAATANVGKRRSAGPVGFYVAGGGVGHSGDNTPMRWLAGPTYVTMKYVNTCNGIVLLADSSRPTTCVLWNPAVAEEEKEVAAPVPVRDECVILGLGCGRRSQTYKLLLSRWRPARQGIKPKHHVPNPKELLVYELGGAAERPVLSQSALSQGLHVQISDKSLGRLRTVLSAGVDGEISKKSIYIDGIIYLYHVNNGAVLAFDVDEETVTTINLPGIYLRGEPHDLHWTPIPQLMEMSGRPCVETYDGMSRALWMLTKDHRWEQRCVIKHLEPCYGGDRQSHHGIPNLSRCSIAGVWDCGGVLLLYLHHAASGDHWLHMTNPSTKEEFQTSLPPKIAPESAGYAFCWGYKPTLLSPESIVGKLSQDEERRRERTAYIMEALKPVSENERREGPKATLNTVCFMEFLVRIMQKLPEDMQDVIEMPLFNSASSADFDSLVIPETSFSQPEGSQPPVQMKRQSKRLQKQL